jgi:membrane-bound lytic murein transglycosylase F
MVRFRPELTEAFALDAPSAVHWAVRSNAPELLASVDRVLAQHFRSREDGTRAGSEFYNVVHARYFADETQMRHHEEHPFRFARTGRLSPYDDLFKAVADSVDLDWRLLAALAFQESRFDPHVESHAGAVGVMQILPRTAGSTADSLRNPEFNVEFGARHLRSLYDAYRFVPGRDRLRFALAAYNCGQGHLDDARILAVQRNKNPNAWSGSVRESLLLLRRPQYHRQVRYGYVRGHETVAYVRDILTRYDLLRQLSQPRRASVDRATFALATDLAN